ncbi:MAG: T9SS type A sorting domain-containing protein, partial [Candidatus Cloacimonetes bacterium]|nr:T9SS type A sorting domain-containing protein [Candidatus Cloacimonadota bacterium]
LWAKRAGGTDSDQGWSITCDAAGNTYVSGLFQATVSFGSTNLTSSGNSDIFVAKIGYTTSIDDDLAPETYSSCLHGAWPNPLRPGETALVKTTVALGETGYLTFFNLRGQTIARHILYTGTQETIFNNSGLSSGIYFYQLQAGNYKEVKKLILAK